MKAHVTSFRLEPLESRMLLSGDSVAITAPERAIWPIVAQPVNLTIDVDDSASIEWDLDYDGTRFDVDQRGLMPRVTFDRAGSLIIAARVIRADGSVELHTFVATVIDSNNEPQNAAIQILAPADAQVGKPVVITLGNSHPGQSAQYLIDYAGRDQFADGFSGPNYPIQLERVFDNAGTHTIRVQLYIDGVYVGSSSHQIIVESPTTEPVSSDDPVQSKPTLFSMMKIEFGASDDDPEEDSILS